MIETAFGAVGGAFAASRWDIEPGAASDWREHGRGEELLYVVAGSGRLALPAESFPLAAESVAWLEPGDRWRLEAGDDGLAVLAARAGTEVAA